MRRPREKVFSELRTVTVTCRIVFPVQHTRKKGTRVFVVRDVRSIREAGTAARLKVEAELKHAAILSFHGKACGFSIAEPKVRRAIGRAVA